MHSFTSFSAVLLSASLACGVLASANIPRALLQVRQGGDAFIPGTRQGFGATCVDAFGPNSKLCANSGTCYDSSIGDSCCSEGYPCGTGSYCLVKGYCCPNSSTPAQCALANGITLPAGFTRASATSAPAASASASASSGTKASVAVSSAPASSLSSKSSVSGAPFLTASSTSAASRPISATGTAGGSGAARTTSASATRATGTSTATIAPFTGGASSNQQKGGAAFALVAVAGAVGLML